MRLFFEKRIVIAFVFACTILAVLAILIFFNSGSYIRSGKAITLSRAIVLQAEQALSNAIDIERGQNSYIIAQEPVFLESYRRSIVDIEENIKRLQELVKDNDSQQKRFNELSALVKRKKHFAQQAMAALDSGFTAASVMISSTEGKALLDSIRSKIMNIQQEEYNRLDGMIEENQADERNFAFAVTALIVFILAIILFVFFTMNRSLKLRLEGEARLKKLSEEMQDLYDNAPCGYHSVDADGYFVSMNQTELNWLGYEKDEVIGKLKFSDIIAPGSFDTFVENFEKLKTTGETSNLEFEFLRKDRSSFFVVLSASAIYNEKGEYLRSRSTLFDQTENVLKTRRIKQLNQEMESFTYSVSHDLRAPLRSITGYSQILQEDFSDKLGKEGQEVLEVVLRNAGRMGQLIDDLLDFSRIGRKNISSIRFSMNEAVKNIIDELVNDEKERQVKIKIHSLHDAAADPVMIRQVWANLLSNAFKYTRKEEEPSIEVGSKKEKGKIIYYVKDNGVGFDMAYSHKLFGVFQRLHKLSDFEGTGVGLAIVKQIVTRHGGTVWSKSEPGNGAVFYFSLPVKVKPNLVQI